MSDSVSKIKENILLKLKTQFGRRAENATPLQVYKAAALCVRDMLMEQWQRTSEELFNGKKKVVYYLSLEYLLGRFLKNNLNALGVYNLYSDALVELGFSLDEIAECERDPGLGNGGLGRLAACFLDSLSCMELPAIGCCIRYDFGLFRQRIVDGEQVELPDNWLEDGCMWEIARPEETVEVKFGGRVVEYFDESGRMCHRLEDADTVLATPYDIPIPGYKNGFCNMLRVWSARSPEYFNIHTFDAGEYVKASAERELAETISRILYPNDSHNAGKSLRLRQQYFFTSATLQYMLRRHKAMGLPLADLPDYTAVQINDTHPAIAIAEMMRLLLDVEGMGWDEAFDICTRLFSYTNHTIMSEALESWPRYLMENLLPRVYMIIKEIDRRFALRVFGIYGVSTDKISSMSIIAHERISMANLCLAVCRKVNGVSVLHTDILKSGIFADFDRLNPEQIIPIVNGISPRRWLFVANPLLSELIDDALGSDEWRTDLSRISALEGYASDPAFVEKFTAVKQKNKERLARYIKRENDIDLDLSSMFDVQVKRLHEYKRQLLNALHILYLYFDIKENGSSGHVPRTFIFGAKAFPGYERAKQIISLIVSISGLVNGDPAVNGLIKVVFIENYGVSSAELIIPAANLSEQISLAGKEASGTGNMKFMMSGALTIGTLDGANVEMRGLLGPENIFIFGMTAAEVAAAYRYRTASPLSIYRRDSRIRRVLDALDDGTLGRSFASLKNYLLYGEGGMADPYFCLTDFSSYAAAQEKLEDLYKNPAEWTRRAIVNTARSHYFSSDRSIAEYNDKIWHLR